MTLEGLANSVEMPLRKTEKLNPHLDFLFRVDLLARTLAVPMAIDELPPQLRGLISSGMMRLDDSQRVQVFIEVDGPGASAASAVAALGLVVERENDELGIIQGWLPVSSLEQVSLLPMVRMVRLPDYAFSLQGSVTSEGDAILKADDMRALFGVNGFGVKVGVISDGMEGLAAAQATGDLPANVNTTTCNMIPGTTPMDPGAGAEGTAMLEIVHDLAPGAELWFGHWGMTSVGTMLTFMEAVQCLSAHVDVVIDDIGFFNAGPYDGTSPVSLNASAALNDPANAIRGYYNAVGNQANEHYKEPFVDSGFIFPGGPDSWVLHRFQATSTTTDGGLGIQCTSNPADGYCGDTVLLPPGGVLTVFLQWDDPWGASSNDYDILLFDVNDGIIYLASGLSQTGTQDPVEQFAWQNLTAEVQPLGILLGRWGLGVTRTFDMFVLCGSCERIDGNSHNFNTVASSVPNNSDAGGGVVSLGAVNASSPNVVAPYSSRGPTNDGRTKPDATAIDGVSVTGNGGFPTTFFGTSAAAPHAGAIAALVLSCAPHLKHGHPGEDPAAERTTLRSALLDSAIDLGPPGLDNTYGAGRLDAVGAANAAGCSPDTSGDGYTDAEKIALGKDPNHYCPIMRADVNHDALVTIVDISLVAGYFGRSIPMAPLRYDQNADNLITIVDISLIASRFGQNVSACV